LQWWLLPFWSKEPRIKYSTFNARIETVAKAASFCDPFKRRRCLIPAVGWYEWQETPSGKQPWYIRPADRNAAMLAGLWDRWQKDDQVIESLLSSLVRPTRPSARFTTACRSFGHLTATTLGLTAPSPAPTT
jgi:putative SOS response-associated peptidase YedK